MRFARSLSILVAVPALLVGCVLPPEPFHDDFMAEEPPEGYPEPESLVPTGAIYQDQGHNLALFEDFRARRVGDILTVLLAESTDAAKSSDTTLDKTNSTLIANPVLFGQPRSWGDDNNLAFELSSDSAFDGGSASNQSNKLQGSVTVTIAKVYPGGNFYVKGEKWQSSTRARSTSACRALCGRWTYRPTTPFYPPRWRTRVSPTAAPAPRRMRIKWAGCRASSSRRSGLSRGVRDDLQAQAQGDHRYVNEQLYAAVDADRSGRADQDLATIDGVRANQLIGYGLVVGLDGSGDKTTQTPFTVQSVKSMLATLGVVVNPGLNPQLKNVAAVMVTAELPLYQARTVHRRDRVLAGQRQSLQRRHPADDATQSADGNIYAMAQGSLVVSGFGAEGADGSNVTVNVMNSGRIPNGALVERAVPSAFGDEPMLVMSLNSPDFTTALRVAKSINDSLGQGVARPVDSATIEVAAPADLAAKVASFPQSRIFRYSRALRRRG